MSDKKPLPADGRVSSGTLLATPRTDALLKGTQGMFRAAAAANGFADFACELERENAKLRDSLKDAIWAADYLAEQQAMPDDGYKARLESARRVLG